MRFSTALTSVSLLAAVHLAGQNLVQPATVQVKNEEAVNSKGLDFSPTFYQDGIVFISTNKEAAGIKKVTDSHLKLPAMSILRSRREAEGGLGKPEAFSKELSSKYHEGPVCFDRTAERVFYSSNVHKNGDATLAKDGQQKQRLYTATKSGEIWGEPQALSFNDNQFDDCHPALGLEGDKMIFASNRPGGQGGMDLYITFKVGDSWSDPINLGPKVNTKGNEVFPFLHADNTLYFTSDGHAGTGGFDLYFTQAEGSEWIAPVNMGKPFNTAGDDFGLIVDLDKKNGYYSSNGNGGQGGDDIFSFHVDNGNLDDYLLQNDRHLDQNLDVLALVTQAENKAVLPGATVRFVNMDESNIIGRDSLGNLISLQNENGKDVMKVLSMDESNASITGVTDTAGRFVGKVKPGNYILIVSKENFQTYSTQVKILKSGNEFPVALEPAKDKVRWNANLFNDQTNAPLAGATLILKNDATGKLDTVRTDASGNVDYYLDKNAKYSVDIYQGGKKVGSTKMDTNNWDAKKNSGKMTMNVSAGALPPGTVIELPNIYYNYNDATLRPDAKKDLDLVAAILKQYPGMTVELSSHTDCRGSDAYNLDLSQRRANNVSDYLVGQKKIAAKRLQPAGYGETKPRNKCKDGVPCTEKEHARNRRTEIKVLGGADGAAIVQVDNNPKTQGKSGGKSMVNQSPLPAGKVRVGTSDDTDYYVIAGSFLMENRAVNHVETVRGAGFAGAEIIQFGNSPFYSVVAKKCDSMDEAIAARNQLVNKELRAFVKPVGR